MVKVDRSSALYNLKTRTKLLASFGLVSFIIFVMATAGVLTIQQLSVASQAVYVDYTVPLADFAEMGTALTSHHQILTNMTNITKQSDFMSEFNRLGPYRAKVNSVISDYEATVLRVSRSGRDEKKDLAILKPAIDPDAPHLSGHSDVIPMQRWSLQPSNSASTPCGSVL